MSLPTGWPEKHLEIGKGLTSKLWPIWNSVEGAYELRERDVVRHQLGSAVAAARRSLGSGATVANVWALICEVAGVPSADADDGRFVELTSSFDTAELLCIGSRLFNPAFSSIIGALSDVQVEESSAMYWAHQDLKDAPITVTRVPARSRPMTALQRKTIDDFDKQDSVFQTSSTPNKWDMREATLTEKHAAILSNVRVEPLEWCPHKDDTKMDGHLVFLEQHPLSRCISVNDPNVSSLQVYEEMLRRQIDPNEIRTFKSRGWCQTWSMFELECNIMGVSRLHQEMCEYYKAAAALRIKQNRIESDAVALPPHVEKIITDMYAFQEYPAEKLCWYHDPCGTKFKAMISKFVAPVDGVPFAEVWLLGRQVEAEWRRGIFYKVPLSTLEFAPDMGDIAEPHGKSIKPQVGPGLSLSYYVRQLAIKYCTIIMHDFSNTMWPSKAQPYKKLVTTPFHREGCDKLYTGAFSLYLDDIEHDKVGSGQKRKKSSDERNRVRDVGC